jgi:electron transfer flavoprotein alpha subunit
VSFPLCRLQRLFDQAKELANAMSAEISGSMPGVRDFGYFDEGASCIGLSGVSLNAKLYVALGISGSTPHIVGLLNAKMVVCVNNDPNAQMFSHADYGILGDVKEVLTEMIKAFR